MSETQSQEDAIRVIEQVLRELKAEALEGKHPGIITPLRLAEEVRRRIEAGEVRKPS